jgi:ABC-type Zn uptake system ZnuABC Zn-binding protein ZnuA
MKKIKNLIYIVFFAIFLPNCRPPDPTLHDSRLRVVATTSIIADIAQNIIGEKMLVQTLLPIGTDPHLHEATPRDAHKVYKANLLLMNGLTLEGWLSELVKNSGTKAKMKTVTEGVLALTSPKYQNSTDPHAWMTVRNGSIYARNIAAAAIDLDSMNKSFYENNLNIYLEKLNQLETYMRKRITEVPENQRVLITSHDAFQYFGREYGFKLESVLGTSTDAEAQTSDIQRITTTILSAGVKAVFVESTVNPKLLHQISTDYNIKIGGSLFADSLGDSASGANTYLDMLKKNIDVIIDGLK